MVPMVFCSEHRENYRTTNGGNTWTERTGFSVSPARVRFGDTDRGWISCYDGEIICFDFNSDSWSEQVVPFSNDLKALFALNQTLSGQEVGMVPF